MGTNFYLMSKNRESVKKNFGEWGDYNIVDEPFLGYEIHLCKRSCGWKPLFQLHTRFSSFKELEQFYMENKEDYKVFDEYGTEYTFEKFKQEMIDHANRDRVPMKWVYENNPLFNPDGRKTLNTKECTEEEAELYIPFSHSEYEATYNAAVKKFHYHTPWGVSSYDYEKPERYVADPDYPFDWVEGDFS